MKAQCFNWFVEVTFINPVSERQSVGISPVYCSIISTAYVNLGYGIWHYIC